MVYWIDCRLHKTGKFDLPELILIEFRVNSVTAGNFEVDKVVACASGLDFCVQSVESSWTSTVGRGQ